MNGILSKTVLGLILLMAEWVFAGTPVDLSSAMQLVDSRPLAACEGIWEYPGDGIRVLILRNGFDPYTYEMTIVESEDVRLLPGTKIGELKVTPGAGLYRLTLCTRILHGLPVSMVDCLARLGDNEEALIVESPKVKITLTPSMILPVFWSKLRTGVRLKYDSPEERLPEGMLKYYPRRGRRKGEGPVYF